jgi:hypothetical protein
VQATIPFVNSFPTRGVIFEDPETGWLTPDAYLSGNVKHKLQVAEKAALAERRFARNVDALRIVIPPDILPGQIDVRCFRTRTVPILKAAAGSKNVVNLRKPCSLASLLKSERRSGNGSRL